MNASVNLCSTLFKGILNCHYPKHHQVYWSSFKIWMPLVSYYSPIGSHNMVKKKFNRQNKLSSLKHSVLHAIVHLCSTFFKGTLKCRYSSSHQDYWSSLKIQMPLVSLYSPIGRKKKINRQNKLSSLKHSALDASVHVC